jgi:NADH-quinone oxidoreductase subunit N
VNALAAAGTLSVTRFPTPSFEYADLAPILIVFVAAIIGVLVEAAAPREWRRPAQLVIAFVGIIASLAAVVTLAGTKAIAAQGSVAVDGPTLFMQGTILVLAFAAFLLFAERTIDPGRDAFAPAGSALPGSRDEQLFTAKGVTQT